MPLFGKPDVEKLKVRKDVNRLIKALRDDRVGDAAAVAIREVGDQQAVEPLISALHHQNQHVREAAAVALGRIGDSRAIESLKGVLKDEHLNVRLKAGEALREMGIDMPNTKIFPLLRCAQCRKLFYYDPEKPIRCPDHPQCELEVTAYPDLPRRGTYLTLSTNVMFFEGCNVVGVGLQGGPPEMCGFGYMHPETYCKLAYDRTERDWFWVEQLPQGRQLEKKTEITTKGDVYLSGLVMCAFGHQLISYRPGRPVGLFIDRVGSWRERIMSCPFHVLDHIQVSFCPDGTVGLKVTEQSLKLGSVHFANDNIIDEVFSICYAEDEGWIWVPKKIKALEEYKEAQKEEERRLLEKYRESEEEIRKKKKAEEDAAIEGFRTLFE